MGAARSRLRRWHVWLGWVVAVPVMFWTVSGLVMVARPIEEVRGTHLLREAGSIRLAAAPVPPRVEGVPLSSLVLQQRADGARWVATLADGTARLADPATGALLPRLSAADAVREVMARYTGDAKVAAASRTDPANPPIEFRRETPAWKVAMDDGTHFYVDEGSGEIVARRTRWWRFYDWMWGLHIMDLDTREDTHNPLVIGFGIAAVVMSLLALALLPLTLRRRRKRT
ncbi:MAG: hypothetical protein M3Q52_01710 [Pseudomonadota bacterium]|nr:hypothetical protein [Pseudomonadota bacterium]